MALIEDFPRMKVLSREQGLSKIKVAMIIFATYLWTESKLDFMPGTLKMRLRWMWVTGRVLPFPTKTRTPPLYLVGCWRLGSSYVKWSVVPVFEEEAIAASLAGGCLPWKASNYNNQRQCVPSYSISDIVTFDSLVLMNNCLENSEVLHSVDCLENHLYRILILISTSTGHPPLPRLLPDLPLPWLPEIDH